MFSMANHGCRTKSVYGGGVVIFLAGIIGVYGEHASAAENLTFVIDPTQSTLVASGTLAGQAIKTFPLGSSSGIGLTTSYRGSINATWDEVANSLQITGAQITAQDNAVQFSFPSNSTPDCYAFFISPFGISTSTFGEAFSGEIRSLSFSIQSPIVTNPQSFDTSLMTGAILGGQLDRTFTTYPLPSLTPTGEFDGTDSLGGNLSFGSNLASLSSSTEAETLTLPVATHINIVIGDGPAAGSILSLQLSGAIVATTATPEPSALLVLAGGSLFFLTRRRFA